MKAIVTGYLVDVLGVVITGMIVNGLLHINKPGITLVINCLFILIGGYAASSVSQKYRLFNAGAIGVFHAFWTFYMSRSLQFTYVILFILVALLGGYASIKNKKTVGQEEQ